MNAPQLQYDPNGKSSFFIEQDGKHIAEMVVSMDDKNLTVYHTEVAPELKGQNIANLLLTTMVDYARTQHLKVIPLCPYVSTQFQRHPDLYSDVWNKSWHQA